MFLSKPPALLARIETDIDVALFHWRRIALRVSLTSHLPMTAMLYIRATPVTPRGYA